MGFGRGTRSRAEPPFSKQRCAASSGLGCVGRAEPPAAPSSALATASIRRAARLFASRAARTRSSSGVISSRLSRFCPVGPSPLIIHGEGITGSTNLIHTSRLYDSQRSVSDKILYVNFCPFALASKKRCKHLIYLDFRVVRAAGHCPFRTKDLEYQLPTRATTGT